MTAYVRADVGVDARLVREAIPDEVVAALARSGRARESRHGVAEHVLALGEAETEARKQIAMHRRVERALVREAAPRDVAHVPRLRVRQKLCPDRGPDAVRA